jgi:hypothetical protein
MIIYFVLIIVIAVFISLYFTPLHMKLSKLKIKEDYYITGYKSQLPFDKRYTLEPGIKIDGFDIKDQQLKGIKNLSKAIILCNDNKNANFFVYNTKDKTLLLKTYQ